MRTSRKMRAVARLALLAIALSAGSITIGTVCGSPAMATQVVPGVIDCAKTDDSLTIHKREEAAGEIRDSGLANKNPAGKPLLGVSYQVALATPIANAGQFSEAVKLRYLKDNAAIDQAVASENKKATHVTGSTGEVNVRNPKLGRYLVAETHAPANGHRVAGDGWYRPQVGDAGWHNGQNVAQIECDQAGLNRLTAAYQAAPRQPG